MFLLVSWLIIVTLALFDALLLLAILGRNSSTALRQSVFAVPFLVAVVTALMAPWRLLALGVLAAVAALQVSAHLLWMRRVRLAALPTPEPVTKRVQVLASGWGVPAPAEVLISPVGPAVAGFWHQTLLLPPDAAALPADEFAAVTGHELAHVRSRDPLKLWLLGLGRTALAWHPLTRAVAHRLHLELEIAADQRAAGWVGTDTYALTLGRWGLRRATLPAVPPGRPAAGLAGQGADLLLRMRSLLVPADPAPHLALAGPLGTRIAASTKPYRLRAALTMYLAVAYIGVFGLLEYLLR